MTDSAFAWAQTHSKIRTNPVHGEQEALLVLNESFQLVDETGSTIQMQGQLEMEDPSGM